MTIHQTVKPERWHTSPRPWLALSQPSGFAGRDRSSL